MLVTLADEIAEDDERRRTLSVPVCPVGVTSDPYGTPEGARNAEVSDDDVEIVGQSGVTSAASFVAAATGGDSAAGGVDRSPPFVEQHR